MPRALPFIHLVMLISGMITSVASGQEQVDSGWKVAKPVIDSGRPDVAGGLGNPQMHLVLDHVLGQTAGEPLQPGAPTPWRERREPRLAERPVDGDGWRSSATAATLPIEPRPMRVEEQDLRAESATWRATELTIPDLADALRAAPLEALREDLEEGLTAEERNDGASESTRELDDEVVSDIAEDIAESETDGTSADDTVDRESSQTLSKSATTPPRDILSKGPPAPLTSQLVNLRTRVRGVLKSYYQKPLNSRENDPWEVMHGMLAYGVHSRIRQGGPRGQLITSVGWLCYNRPCKGLSLLYVTPEGELRAKQGVGLQGHMGQLLAMLAQCHVSTEYPIRVGEHQFTVQDLIEAEKKTCYPRSELTFKLIAFSTYLDLNETWINDQGLEWDMPRLIREELAQPIRGAACGGTHRLSGLSLAVKARETCGEPIDGEYARAAEFVRNYQNYAFRMQNRDGSLSTKWFQGPGDEDNIDRRVKTTGHILEWLVYSLADDELREQRVIRSVLYLSNLLQSNYKHEWEVGPLSHAIHALLLYDQRVFQPHDNEAGELTGRPGGSKTSGVVPAADRR
jgi:hypothetical protein